MWLAQRLLRQHWGQHFDPLAPSGQSSAAQFDPLAGTASAANFDPLAPAPKPGLAANFDPLGAAPHAAPASVAHDFDPLGMPAPAALAPIPAPVPAPAPVFAPIPAPIPAPAPVFAPIPAPVPAPIAAPFAPIAAPVAAPVPSVPRGANDGEVMAALLRGLGLPEMKTKLSDPQLAELVGAMLREAVDGTMGVLTARSMTKREIRIEATMIASKGNNPMKFFPDSEAALSQMADQCLGGLYAGREGDE